MNLPQPIAIYTYYDAAGVPLRRKLRLPGKEFVWESFDPVTQHWYLGAKNSTSTLYKLELLAATTKPRVVYITEGEKDCDHVNALGLLAVTSGAAGTWGRHHSEQLKHFGCTLAIVFPDQDAAGEEHVYDVARENLAVGIPTKIVTLPELNDHEDVSDFLDRGGTREDLIGFARCAKLVTLADLPKAEPEKPSSRRPRRLHDPRLNKLYIETLKLRPNARGHLMASCPFHPDANPSFSLDLDNGLWFCFAGCGGGNALTFYIKVNALRGRTLLRTEAWRRLQATYL